MPKPLTAAAVAKYRPGPRRRTIRDTGAQSLYLVIQPSGRKSWMMRFRRPGGKPGKLVLGPVYVEGEPPGEPTVGMPLTLAGARQLAAAVHRERALGRDPVADHKARRHRQRAELETRAAGTSASAPAASRTSTSGCERAGGATPCGSWVCAARPMAASLPSFPAGWRSAGASATCATSTATTSTRPATRRAASARPARQRA